MPFDWWPGIPIALRTGVWPLDVQVLCHANGCPDSLQRVAARQAFWQFTFGDLGHICEEFGCPLNKKQSLIDRLVTLIKFFIPDISDDELLVILEKRLQMPNPHLSLLDMFDDEGLDKILDPDARKILREEKVASAKVIEGDDLIRTYTKTMRLRLHPPPRPVKRRGKVTLHGREYPATYEDIRGDVDLADLKSLLPPHSCTIYEDLNVHRWQVSIFKWSRSAAWRKFGGRFGAALVVLRFAWTVWETQGHGDCPINGL